GQTIINRVILGHPPKTPGPRLSILPLPSIGHRHSDGRIRRVLLTEPFGSDGHVIQVLGELLQGHSLQPEDPADDLGISLVRIQRYDPVVECYIGSTRTWSSATPVLLPGYDDRKQHRGDQQKRFARAEQLVCKALRQADIEQPADIAITRVPLIPGTNHVRDARPRQKLAHYPRYHVRLTFNQSFTGPLSIGAGRHAGFGVMASIT
ncbi:MAG: type I-U CRISPR-associated protein Csb2, partial [Phycisphaeraceae bacterium]